MIKIKSIFFLFWFIFVYSGYIFFHFRRNIDVTIYALCVVMIFYTMYKIIYKKWHIRIHFQKIFPMWGALLIIFLFTLFFSFLFNVGFSDNYPKYSIGLIFSSWAHIFLAVFLRLLFICALVATAISFGKKILDSFRFQFDSLSEEVAFSFGAGFLGMLFISFALGTLTLLYFWNIVFLALAIIFLCRKEMRYYCNILFHHKIEFRIPDCFCNQKNLFIIGACIVVLFIIFTFIQTFRYFSSDLDDLDIYYSVPILFSHYHGAVPLYNSIAAMTSGITMPFYAAVNTILSPNYNFSLSWLFLWLSLFLLYLFTKRFFSQKIAFITIFLAAFVPLHVVFVNTQKIDFILVFFSILSIYCIFQWLHSKESKWLYLSAVFLGLTIHIKMNGLFLALTIFMLLSIFLFFRKIPLRQYILYFVFALVALLPMFFYNIYYYGNPLAPFRFKIVANNNENIFASHRRVTAYDIYSKTDYIYRNPDDYTALTRQNNISDSKLINFFWTLWNVTINQKGFNFLYAEIGPFLLIFLPFFLLHFFIKKYYKDKNLVALLALSGIYFSIWYMKGYERAWYALPLLYFLFIFCAWYLEKMEKSRIAAMLHILIIVFSLRTLFFSFFLMGWQPHIINSQNISTVDFKKYPGGETIVLFPQYINNVIIHKDKESLILMFPSSLTASIYEWDKHVIADNFGMYWIEALDKSKNLQELRDVFVRQRITHIVFARNDYEEMKSFTDSIERYPFLKKIGVFEEFKNLYLEEMQCINNYYCIYKIK
ncbi:MAG: Glycosyl transferase, family 39 [Parcubacteria group bacterium GW2011_GWA2_38_13]|nr:MAG: Glycosyl transferase, family 39 [Parcubacteria group bacterium GW2011_GWA2_38_13]